MRLLKKTVKEPLFQYLLAALALFMIYDARDIEQEDDFQTITVTPEELVTFIGLKAKQISPAQAQAMVETANDERLETLVNGYVRDEVLYREALSMDMDKDDYIIKQRAVKKAHDLLNGIVQLEQENAITEEELITYYQKNIDQYQEPQTISFSHVFFMNRKQTQPAAEKAEKALKQLNDLQVSADQAATYGDSFPHLINYEQISESFIASHFGEAMASQLMGIEPGNQWHGPFTSPYGSHLVLITESIPGWLPELEQIEKTVQEDLVKERITQARERSIAKIVNSYRVQREYLGPEAKPETAKSEKLAAY